MKTFFLAIAAAASMTTTAAFAEAYVGAAVGQSHIEMDCTGATTCKKTDTGYKLFGGYKFTPNLAGELSYIDYGTFKAADSGSALNLKTTGFGVGVAFFGDFAPRWSGVARLGVASNKVKATASLGNLSGSESESNAKAYAGFGIGYELSKGLKLDASMDFSQAEILGESGSVRLLSVGLSYAF